MAKEAVFATEAEAEAQQEKDLVEHFKHHAGVEYQKQTTRWATPVQRLDGKWAYPICDHQDYGGITLEDIDPANYPTPEES